MLRPISLSIGGLQNRFGDLRALEIASEIGADAVDFDTCSRRFDYRNPDSVYARSDEEITAYFSALRARADALGITVGQTHGRTRMTAIRLTEMCSVCTTLRSVRISRR